MTHVFAEAAKNIKTAVEEHPSGFEGRGADSFFPQKVVNGFGST